MNEMLPVRLTSTPHLILSHAILPRMTNWTGGILLLYFSDFRSLFRLFTHTGNSTTRLVESIAFCFRFHIRGHEQDRLVHEVPLALERPGVPEDQQVPLGLLDLSVPIESR